MNPVENPSMDALLLVVLPLVILTIVNTIKQWSQLWDANLTGQDRDGLMRLMMFVLMPIVVLFHELGHAAAILWFGGKVAEFHYGFLWGYVVPSGLFTPEQILIIFLAGNVVEICFGLVSFVIALLAKSPPIVAVFTYLAVWSVAGTVIVYTLMSLFGMYGDWIAIYTTPVHSWIPIIALCHATLIAAVMYGLLGQKPKLWFARKTRPQWAERRDAVENRLLDEPTIENYLDLAWIDYEAGLDASAQIALSKALAIQPDSPDCFYLKGWLLVNKGKNKDAQHIFSAVVERETTSPLLRARSAMAIGQIAESDVRKQSRNTKITADMWQPALDAYTTATRVAPDLADPRYYRARLLNKVGLHNQALEELQEIDNCRWLDPSLRDMVQVEVALTSRQTPEAQ